MTGKVYNPFTGEMVDSLTPEAYHSNPLTGRVRGTLELAEDLRTTSKPVKLRDPNLSPVQVAVKKKEVENVVNPAFFKTSAFIGDVANRRSIVPGEDITPEIDLDKIRIPSVNLREQMKAKRELEAQEAKTAFNKAIVKTVVAVVGVFVVVGVVLTMR